MKKLFVYRWALQLASTLASNPLLWNFFTGSIHRGATKAVCVPGLNCYSCPAAVGACPLGSLQSFLAGNRSFPAYVVGFLLLVGVLLGRAVCGFLCPFGWLQDGLSRLGRRLRIRVPDRVDRPLRWVKYVLLALFVIVLPLIPGAFGTGDPAFCKYVCPAGTLGAGLPLIAAESSLRASVGALFYWKLALALAIIAACVLIPRAFCRYLCPLGAIYSLFNRVSLFALKWDEERCIGCGKCEAVCPMQVKVTGDINSAECIRCGKCMLGCPTDAIGAAFGFEIHHKEEET